MYFCHLKKLVRMETFGPYYIQYNTIQNTYIYLDMYTKKSAELGIQWT